MIKPILNILSKNIKRRTFLYNKLKSNEPVGLNEYWLLHPNTLKGYQQIEKSYWSEYSKFCACWNIEPRVKEDIKIEDILRNLR